MKLSRYYGRLTPPCKRPAIMGLVLMALFLAPRYCPAAELADILSPSAVLFGYGSSYPGWGQTKIRVETIDTVLRYELPKYHDLGSSWYKGDHTVFIEVPVHFLVDRSGPPMIGCTFLANYTFTESKQYRPYVFAGGGPLYVPADIPGMGTHVNGNYQCGIGMHYPLEGSHALIFEVRYHHVSNAGLAEPNDPLNSLKFMLGYTF
jgi:lipid A 3-O-deacylase